MWRVKSGIALGVMVGVLIFGAAIAYGSWWWNSHIDVEGVDVRTIWTVTDDPEGEKHYHTDIVVRLPVNAEAEIKSQAETETVHLVADPQLKCLPNGIQSIVHYVVHPLEGAIGTEVAVLVTADDHPIGSNTGGLNQVISVRGLIPGSCSGLDYGNN